MHKLVLLRHGLSDWNLQDRFTGWQDIDLAQAGITEAHDSGKSLREAGFSFDLACTSLLKRAIRTLWIILDELDQMWIPVLKDWRLNERHYGALTGLNKSETVSKHGEKQVLIWRRSYDIRPPEVDEKDPRFPGNDFRYSAMDRSRIPRSESLKDTLERVVEYWNEEVSKRIKEGKKVLIVAHGNSLRALVKYLDNIDDKEIPKLNIPTGIPLIYELDDYLRPIRNHYLGSDEELSTAINSVVNSK